MTTWSSSDRISNTALMRIVVHTLCEPGITDRHPLPRSTRSMAVQEHTILRAVKMSTSQQAVCHPIHELSIPVRWTHGEIPQVLMERMATAVADIWRLVNEHGVNALSPSSPQRTQDGALSQSTSNILQGVGCYTSQTGTQHTP